MKEEPKIELNGFVEEGYYKSVFIIGNIKVCNTKKFNWFQKKMIKIFFGFEVEDYE